MPRSGSLPAKWFVDIRKVIAPIMEEILSGSVPLKRFKKSQTCSTAAIAPSSGSLPEKQFRDASTCVVAVSTPMPPSGSTPVKQFPPIAKTSNVVIELMASGNIPAKRFVERLVLSNRTDASWKLFKFNVVLKLSGSVPVNCAMRSSSADATVRQDSCAHHKPPNPRIPKCFLDNDTDVA
eukprot:517921-Amphidinium_carterae.1